jgi:FimV-like protein
MKDTIKLDLIELLESGKTYEESKEVQLIVDASAEALKFYNDYQVSKDQLAGFFDKDKLEASQDKMSAFLDKQLNETPANQDFSYKGFAAMAVAASALLIGINLYTPEALEPVTEETIEVVQLEPQIEIVEEIIVEEPIMVNTSDTGTIWSAGTKLAEEYDLSLYNVMYALYEANPEAFTDGNIHAMKADNVLILDESMMNSVSTDFAYSEVRRHIYCRC